LIEEIALSLASKHLNPGREASDLFPESSIFLCRRSSISLARGWSVGAILFRNFTPTALSFLHLSAHSSACRGPISPEPPCQRGPPAGSPSRSKRGRSGEGSPIYNRQLTQEGPEQVESSAEKSVREMPRGASTSGEAESFKSFNCVGGLCRRNTFVRARVLHLSAVHAHDYREPR
jgi:hypothetical protein